MIWHLFSIFWDQRIEIFAPLRTIRIRLKSWKIRSNSLKFLSMNCIVDSHLLILNRVITIWIEIRHRGIRFWISCSVKRQCFWFLNRLDMSRKIYTWWVLRIFISKQGNFSKIRSSLRIKTTTRFHHIFFLLKRLVIIIKITFIILLYNSFKDLWRNLSFKFIPPFFLINRHRKLLN